MSIKRNCYIRDFPPVLSSIRTLQRSEPKMTQWDKHGCIMTHNDDIVGSLAHAFCSDQCYTIYQNTTMLNMATYRQCCHLVVIKSHSQCLLCRIPGFYFAVSMPSSRYVTLLFTLIGTNVYMGRHWGAHTSNKGLIIKYKGKATQIF